MAVSDGDLLTVRAYLGRGKTTLQCQVDNGWSLLHLAAMSGKRDLAALLIRKGADVKACDIAGTTPLHYAVREHHRSVVELLLTEGAYVDAVHVGGDRPLHEAMMFSPPETGSGDADDEWAAEKRREYADALRIVELLLKHGATVDVPDGNGNTALHIAASYDNPAAVEALVAAGASVDVKDAQGRTPAEVASSPELAARLRAR
jgi:ankyrin repeat protein